MNQVKIITDQGTTGVADTRMAREFEIPTLVAAQTPVTHPGYQAKSSPRRMRFGLLAVAASILTASLAFAQVRTTTTPSAAPSLEHVQTPTVSLDSASMTVMPEVIVEPATTVEAPVRAPAPKTTKRSSPRDVAAAAPKNQSEVF